MQVTKRVGDWERTIISAISGSLSTRDFSRSYCERKSEYARLSIFWGGGGMDLNDLPPGGRTTRNRLPLEVG
jgi:hypothetical protein